MVILKSLDFILVSLYRLPEITAIKWYTTVGVIMEEVDLY